MPSAFDAIPSALESPTPQPLRCTHIFRSGTRCPRTPVDGEMICVVHGGSMEQATESIQRRMLALKEQSVTIAEELLATGDDKIRAQVMVAVWDRTGLGPKSTIQVEDKSAAVSTLSMDELAREFEHLAHLTRAEQLKRQRMNEALMTTSSASDIKH